MHELHLLIDIAMVLVTAFVGGLLARRLGLPSLVGYLLAGMAIGPFTPGFVGDLGDISQLAELGVIFLMFGVGLHFSLRDLSRVRAVAIPGALLRMIITTMVGFGLGRLWGWPSSAALLLGMALSIASTVVLLRGLMDNGLLNTLHGQVAVGWLVLEDLATIVILVLLPVLFAGEAASSWQGAAWAVLKAAVFVGVMLLAGARLLPWLLTHIAFTRSRELFVLAVVAMAVGTAIGSAEIFGVSLALGAFLAGVVLGESAISYQIGAEVVPFQDLFTVVFFVSVGMLVNPGYLLANIGHVLALTAIIVLGKGLLTVLLGLVLPASARIMLVVAAGSSQIGEFSFIIGQAGMSFGVLTQNQYSLILAGALISIVLHPLLFWLIPRAERWLQRIPRLWRRLDRQGTPLELAEPSLTDHVVIIGYGRVGEHIVTVLERLEMPHLVVEKDANRAAEFDRRGVPTLVGDAANSEILTHAGLEHARALVVTVPDETAAEMVVTTARALAPDLPIIARAASQSGVLRLTRMGAQDVILPELEGGLEVVGKTLLVLGFPAGQVQPYTDAVRRDRYNTAVSSGEEAALLDQMRNMARYVEITWRMVHLDSPLAGQTLGEAAVRVKTGASVIAILRGLARIPNPNAATRLEAGDHLAILGNAEQLAALDRLLVKPAHADTPASDAPASDGSIGDATVADAAAS